MDLITVNDADRKAADNAQEHAKLLASVHLPQLLNIAVEKALDPTATIKNVLDTADFAYRLSGMAKKQEEKSGGSGFNLVINIPQIGGETARTIEIGSSSVTRVTDAAVEETEALLASVPDYITSALAEPAQSDFSDFDLTLDNLEDE